MTDTEGLIQRLAELGACVERCNESGISFPRAVLLGFCAGVGRLAEAAARRGTQAVGEENERLEREKGKR